jgi:hypothetical protein
MGTGSRYGKYGIEPVFDYIMVECKYSEGGVGVYVWRYVCVWCVCVGRLVRVRTCSRSAWCRLETEKYVCTYIKYVPLLTREKGF